jgi:hypothetical protein
MRTREEKRAEKLKELVERSLDIIDAMNSTNHCRVCGWYKKPLSDSHREGCPLESYLQESYEVLYRDVK